MSLLTGIIRGNSPLEAKQLAHLINIIRALGWGSLMDPIIIKPNLRSCELYIRKYAPILSELYNVDFTTIKRKDIVDTINPFLIQMWHVQIIGNVEAASLELLRNSS